MHEDHRASACKQPHGSHRSAAGPRLRDVTGGYSATGGEGTGLIGNRRLVGSVWLETASPMPPTCLLERWNSHCITQMNLGNGAAFLRHIPHHNIIHIHGLLGVLVYLQLMARLALGSFDLRHGTGYAWLGGLGIIDTKVEEHLSPSLRCFPKYCMAGRKTDYPC